MNIIGPSTHMLDLGVSMSSDCMFDYITNLYKRCSYLAGCILVVFSEHSLSYDRSSSNAHPV